MSADLSRYVKPRQSRDAIRSLPDSVLHGVSRNATGRPKSPQPWVGGVIGTARHIKENHMPNFHHSMQPDDRWTATADGRVVDQFGATVALCYQLPLDPVPAATKARFIATACNAYHGQVAALRDDRPGIQAANVCVACVNCCQEYTGEWPEPEFCDIEDCPASAPYCVVVAPEPDDAQHGMDVVCGEGEGPATG